MKEEGPKCNIERSLFGQTEMEYLCFQVTRDGIKTTDRKIEAINNMNPPTYPKEVQKFIGVINSYQNMCSRRSHTLSPLTRLICIKRRFKWPQVKQDAFEKIKCIAARNNLSTYP